MEFTHLHLHTQYSLLDGAIRMGDLFPRIMAQGMNAVAVTDHGNMFGAVDFYKRAKAVGVKPIFGCETYVSSTDRHDRTSRRNYHLILLAKDNAGYKNLSYLNSMGYLEGFYYHPRIDKRILRDHSEGLVALSACLGGEVAQTLLKQGYERAKDVALEYQDIFGAGNYYLEVQPNGLPEQENVNDNWRKLSREAGIPLVATNDCHYVFQRDARAHEILMCIQQGKTIHDERRMHHKTDAYYIKSPAEMNAYFKDLPEALENAAKIGALCNVTLDLGKTFLPRYTVPEGYDLDSYLRKIAEDGLERHLRELAARGAKLDRDQYRERLDREISVICKMGFSGYFLIVWDFIHYAKQQGIPVGPGRGSGVGSLVAYSMGITGLDPLAHNLLFERFLNLERVSMPDFDVDFCMNRREEVIKYVAGKYGTQNVGQIVTMHQLKARGVIRDIGRVMAIPYAEVDKVAKLVPEPVQGKSPPITEAIEKEPRLKELYDNDPKYKDLLDVAQALEGLNRHAGMHAAGVVISEEPLWEYVPCFRGQNGEIVTQFAKEEVEQAGLVKFDFLGLKTLTVLDEAVKLINGAQPEGGAKLDLGAIPMDDAEVYRMIAAGDTTGVFQFESSGFRELLKKLKPDCFEDIVAAGALYRPGPLEGGMVDDFVRRKHGQTRVKYAHPWLEPILKETYGVIVYQEQVMKIASRLAGYSLGQADLLRRAMGKKKKEVMEKEKTNFMAGARTNGVDEKVADEIFELMAFFAGYGFNKSHSAAYALVTYQTAYLKRHYPVEFMAGLLTCDKDNTDNIVKFIAEARAMGIGVDRPDVDESAADFSVVHDEKSLGGKAILFGMGAVKGIGQAAVDAVLEARAAGGEFASLYDFCERVDLRRVNKKALEAFIKSGAFDSVARTSGKNRATLFADIDRASERAQGAQRDRASGQTSLFGLLEAAPQSRAAGAAGGTGAAAGVAAPGPAKEPGPPDVEEWSPKQLLAFEKESLGFYITGHPLDRYMADLDRFKAVTTADIGDGRRSGDVSIGGVVSEYRERIPKSGVGRMAFFNLEDPFGHVEVLVFPKAFERVEQVLKCDEPLLVSGTLRDESEDGQPAYKIILEDALPLSRLRAEKTTRVEVKLDVTALGPPALEQLKEILRRHGGGCRTVLKLRIPGESEVIVPLGPDYAVTPTDELLLQIERLVGGAGAITLA